MYIYISYICHIYTYMCMEIYTNIYIYTYVYIYIYISYIYIYMHAKYIERNIYTYRHVCSDIIGVNV